MIKKLGDRNDVPMDAASGSDNARIENPIIMK